MIRFNDLENLDANSIVTVADRWREAAFQERDQGDGLRDVWQKLPDSWSGDTAVAAANRIGKLTDTELHYDFQHLFGGQEPFPPERTVAHRQMSPDGESPALHVLQRDDGRAQVHIDFVPVVEGRNADGSPDFIISDVPEHIAKDLKGWTHEDDIYDRYNQLDHRVPEIEEQLRELAWQGGQDTPESRRLTKQIEERLAAEQH